jgi:hypothetical protein
MGAIDSNRLEMFQMRREEMKGEEGDIHGSREQYLYGTHFLSLNHVINYTVRKMPELMVRLLIFEAVEEFSFT